MDTPILAFVWRPKLLARSYIPFYVHMTHSKD